MNWISVTEQLPPLDESAGIFDKSAGRSVEVLTYSEEGKRFGYYFANIRNGFWQVNNVTSSESIPVTHWMLIENP